MEGQQMRFLPKASQYPKRIYVKGEVYKVTFTTKIKHFGDTDSETKVIRIRSGMSKRETFKTFLHELLHAIEFECDFKSTLKHSQIYDLEDAIFELLIDNFL
jgi:hypothetical protein